MRNIAGFVLLSVIGGIGAGLILAEAGSQRDNSADESISQSPAKEESGLIYAVEAGTDSKWQDPFRLAVTDNGQQPEKQNNLTADQSPYKAGRIDGHVNKLPKERQQKNQEIIRLTGVVGSNEHYAAIIECASQSGSYSVGDTVNGSTGYRIESISPQKVILVNAEQQLVLYIGGGAV